MPPLKPVQQALSYLSRVMPSKASPCRKKPPLHCSTMPSWKVQRWGQMSALALPHVDLFVQQRVKNYAHKHAQAWEISGPAFQMISFFGAIPSYFCSASFIFFTTFLAPSLRFSRCAAVFCQRMAWESSAQNSHMRKGLLNIWPAR